MSRHKAARLRRLADKLYEPNRRHIGAEDHKFMMDTALLLEEQSSELIRKRFRLTQLKISLSIIKDFMNEEVPSDE